MHYLEDYLESKLIEIKVELKDVLSDNPKLQLPLINYHTLLYSLRGGHPNMLDSNDYVCGKDLDRTKCPFTTRTIAL